MKTIRTAVLASLFLLLTLAVATPVAAQTTVTQTTLSAALSIPTQGVPANFVTVTSATGIGVGSELFVDAEAMLVTGQGTTTTNLTVQRGYDGTRVVAHPINAVTYSGPSTATGGTSPFVFSDPNIGSCTLSNEAFSLRINTQDGNIWACTGSQWLNVIDSYQWVPASACIAAGSTATAQTLYGVAGTTGLGNIPTGASAIPVYQYASTAGTSHNYACQIPVPTRTNLSRGAYLVDATFYYGVQQTLLPTQAATLASGFFNGTTVFTTITMPTPGAAETASTVTPVRADAGSLLITPPVASFNVALTTAGAFDSVKFTPATPIALTSDFTGYYMNVNFLVTTGVMTTNTPGFVVHYRTTTGL